jgi:histidinol dehydrogenase
LVTTSERLAEGAEMEAAKQLESLPRKEIAKASWENNGKIFVADSIAQAVEFANAYAPEHLEIITKNAEKVAEKITNAGAIFAGKWSCEALGDCGFGPNHTLPTGGAARAYGGLSSGSFCKETSVMVVSEGDSKGFAKIAASIARAEGLEGHARSARKRMG